MHALRVIAVDDKVVLVGIAVNHRLAQPTLTRRYTSLIVLKQTTNALAGGAVVDIFEVRSATDDVVEIPQITCPVTSGMAKILQTLGKLAEKTPGIAVQRERFFTARVDHSVDLTQHIDVKAIDFGQGVTTISGQRRRKDQLWCPVLQFQHRLMLQLKQFAGPPAVGNFEHVAAIDGGDQRILIFKRHQWRDSALDAIERAGMFRHGFGVKIGNFADHLFTSCNITC